MVGFLITIHTLICILLVSVILMQASQGGGLSGTIGGGMSNAIFAGLEPARTFVHCPLKTACLPVPPLRLDY